MTKYYSSQTNRNLEVFLIRISTDNFNGIFKTLKIISRGK